MTQQDLKIICANKLQESKQQNNQDNIKIYTLIQEMLNHDNALKQLGVEVSLNLLRDLGFDKDQAQQIYLDAIK